MAIYTQYTPEQASEINYLINRGTNIHKRMSISEKEDDKHKLEEEFKIIKGQLNDVLNAQAICDAHIRAAKEHIEAAEAIIERYGLKVCG